MTSFETRVVKTWDPSVFLRGVFLVLLLAGSSVISFFEVKETWLRISGSLAFIIGLLGALSQSFIRPKDLGVLKIDKTILKIDLADSEKVFSIPELREIGLNYRGYASFWKFSLLWNKNHIFFTTLSGEKYDYEIVLENKQKKEELQEFLTKLGNANTIRSKKFGNATL
ncbi:hypothetical protein DET49_105105 [Salegentibacter sp. 24]|uniref:hypothetical protein n=1 Tax=Salegentibacter sp. 24 TaxID=2183986 RepID=UPI00105D5847|nr:hypothetical protein [Salegentibacter sp. 24]TDN90444.1 hypothetical protein DET49_105105 [Salegentibacter sp. 24]